MCSRKGPSLLTCSVPLTRLNIGSFWPATKDALLLDVRSPGEYAHAHMPGAFSLPLFTNEERAVVGTAYKQESREQAIKIGLDYFGPKMRGMVEEVERILHSKYGASKNVYLYCWRGGMRSGAVAWLLNLYGFSVHVLEGGYKAFRNEVLHMMQQPYALRVVGGYTGSGKTEVLHALKNAGEQVIDLEAIAGHKGSAFGNIGLPPQPGQEQFENLLAEALLPFHSIQVSNPAAFAAHIEDLPPWSSLHETAPALDKQASATIEDVAALHSKPVWIEDESQRIGLVNIPNAFWNTMRAAPVYFLDIPFEERLEHLVEEYGGLDRERLGGAIERITKRLGGQHAKAALQFLAENNMKECFSILLSYYDKHYGKGLHNREGLEKRLHFIPSQAVGGANANLLLQHTI